MHLVDRLTRLQEYRDILLKSKSTSTIAVCVVKKLMLDHMSTFESVDKTRPDGSLQILFDVCPSCNGERKETVMPRIQRIIQNISLNNFTKFVNRSMKAKTVTLSMAKDKQKANTQYQSGVKPSQIKVKQCQSRHVPTVEEAEGYNRERLKKEVSSLGMIQAKNKAGNKKKLEFARELVAEKLDFVFDMDKRQLHKYCEQLFIPHLKLNNDEMYLNIYNYFKNGGFSFLDQVNLENSEKDLDELGLEDDFDVSLEDIETFLG